MPIPMDSLKFKGYSTVALSGWCSHPADYHGQVPELMRIVEVPFVHALKVISQYNPLSCVRPLTMHI
jgi:hypothetical protein